MKTCAAVAFAAGKPLAIAEVDLEAPEAGEALAELKASAVCHADAFTLSSDDAEGVFPAISGPKGAGIVRKGGACGRADGTKIIDWFMDGKINTDDLITHTMPPDEINTAFDLMQKGESIRSVVIY